MLDFLLERKAVDDLASSIKDGRYARQKAAMRATGLRRLMYVLKGEPAMLPSECSALQRLIYFQAVIGQKARCVLQGCAG